MQSVPGQCGVSVRWIVATIRIEHEPERFESARVGQQPEIRNRLSEMICLDGSTLSEQFSEIILYVFGSIDLKMIMGPDAEIVHPLPEELAGRGIAVKIFNQEQKLAAEGLKMIQLDPCSRGYIGVPVVLLMVLEVNRKNRPQ